MTDTIRCEVGAPGADPSPPPPRYTTVHPFFWVEVQN